VEYFHHRHERRQLEEDLRAEAERRVPLNHRGRQANGHPGGLGSRSATARTGCHCLRRVRNLRASGSSAGSIINAPA
jgi:hypothetical protein